MKKKKIVPILVLAALLLAGAALVFGRVLQREPEEIVIMASTTEPTAAPTPAATPAPTPTPTPEPTPTPYVSPIDFESLWAENPDVIAWLEIPGTPVSYPVLQHPWDDQYYLNRRMDGSEGLPGSIFVFSGGSPFRRFNTILYGHNMADGSMFGSLKNYRDMDWLLEHRQVLVYTPEATYTYRIFASTSFDSSLISAVYDDSLEQDRIAYLDRIYNDGMPEKTIPGDVEITTADRIITLSTCVDSQPDMRRLVLALLEHTEPEWKDLDS